MALVTSKQLSRSILWSIISAMANLYHKLL